MIPPNKPPVSFQLNVEELLFWLTASANEDPVASNVANIVGAIVGSKVNVFSTMLLELYVGDAVEYVVVTIVGVTVGIDLGAVNGILVGTGVSKDVGTTVGFAEGASLGNTEGAADGTILGETVWTKEGEIVCAALGDIVVTIEGVSVGSKLGIKVGDIVGTIEGVPVGSKLGTKVGIILGEIVGASEDVAVGTAVGATFGTAEGAMVGTTLGVTVGNLVGAEVGASVLGMVQPRWHLRSLMQIALGLQHMLVSHPYLFIAFFEFTVAMHEATLYGASWHCENPGNCIHMVPGSHKLGLLMQLSHKQICAFTLIFSKNNILCVEQYIIIAFILILRKSW